MLFENPKATSDEIVETFTGETLEAEAGQPGTDAWKAGTTIGNWLVGPRSVKAPASLDNFESSPIYPVLEHYLVATVRLVKKPATWKMIERVAAELVRRRSDLTMDDVVALAYGSKEFGHRSELRNRKQREA
jgi:hypothetical protein